MLHELGEVNPTHAYYNGSCTIKDTEDPSWSTSFKTRRTQKTSSALKSLWKTLFVLYLYLIGTLNEETESLLMDAAALGLIALNKTTQYLNGLEEEYQVRALLAKSKRFFKKGSQRFSRQLKILNATNVVEMVTLQETDEEDVLSNDNEVMEVKALMALAEEERVFVSKECAKNREWVQISIRKVHTLLELEDNDERKFFLDYFCIDLNYVEEQRNNLLSKHRDLVQTLNTCKEQLLVLKQAKLDCTTMQHASTEILKENKNLRKELNELESITKTWLNSSKQVNQCISEQIPSQNKRILGVGQLTEYPSSSGLKDLVFIKSSADNTKASIPSVERPWLSEAEGFIFPNHDTDRILPAESQRNSTDPLVVVIDSSETEYNLADESSVCSTSFPPLKKLDGAAPISGPKTI
ncbi:hypothetical protein Tco_1208916 [Tanacetum coccineum]